MLSNIPDKIILPSHLLNGFKFEEVGFEILANIYGHEKIRFAGDLCVAGRMFEVKSAYIRHFKFTLSQMKKFKNRTIIFIDSDKKVYLMLKYSKIRPFISKTGMINKKIVFSMGKASAIPCVKGLPHYFTCSCGLRTRNSFIMLCHLRIADHRIKIPSCQCQVFYFNEYGTKKKCKFSDILKITHFGGKNDFGSCSIYK
jgi:hypothetical protein